MHHDHHKFNLDSTLNSPCSLKWGLLFCTQETSDKEGEGWYIFPFVGLDGGFTFPEQHSHRMRDMTSKHSEWDPIMSSSLLGEKHSRQVPHICLLWKGFDCAVSVARQRWSQYLRPKLHVEEWQQKAKRTCIYYCDFQFRDRIMPSSIEVWPHKKSIIKMPP